MNQAERLARARSASKWLLWGLPLALFAPWLPPVWLDMGSLGLIVALGVPHGASDLQLLREQGGGNGSSWISASVYLMVTVSTVAVWWVAPRTSLLVFLVLSMVHFGLGDAIPERGLLRILDSGWRGMLVVVLPCLCWPLPTRGAFAALCGDPVFARHLVEFFGQRGWLLALAAVGFLEFVMATHGSRLRACLPSLVEGALLALWFVLVPPLAAFAVYFVGVHAVNHQVAMSGRPFDSTMAAWRQSYQRTGLVLAGTAALGISMWGVIAVGQHGHDALLRTVFTLIAALTVPHIWIVQRWSKRRGACA